MSEPAVEVSGLRVMYGPAVALEGVAFRADAGERVAVVGPNGAGKSTLFRSIAGLLPVRDGSVRLHAGGNGSRAPVAYLPQRPGLDWSFPLTVLDAVTLGLDLELGRHRARTAALDTLELVGLGELLSRRINRLSGGEQQRLLIARAIARSARVLLMDEPLAALDAPARERVFRCVRDLADGGVAVLIALHDLNFAAANFPRVILLNRTVIADGSPEQVFNEANLSRTYGSHLRVVRTEEGGLIVSDMCCQERAL